MRKIFQYILVCGLMLCGLLISSVQAQGNGGTDGGETITTSECNGIKLNTNVPFIGNCIEVQNTTSAFPTLMSALIKIVLSVTLIVCFILIIIAGIMIASNNKLGKGMDLIKKVAITIVLLGLSGVILKLINPTFFG